MREEVGYRDTLYLKTNGRRLFEKESFDANNYQMKITLKSSRLRFKIVQSYTLLSMDGGPV